MTKQSCSDSVLWTADYGFFEKVSYREHRVLRGFNKNNCSSSLCAPSALCLTFIFSQYIIQNTQNVIHPVPSKYGTLKMFGKTGKLLSN